MKKIKLLDNLTIEKIAAGEVIERPASIVKELLENSIDANSKNITVEIKNGGKSFIRLTDDGDGIGEEDLSLAFKRHSTSKLSTIEDLYKIQSLGFRGEALSSISSVAKIKIMTKTEESMAGVEADIENGEIVEKKLVGCPKGTTMIVRDLFYNLPVRKDFLKSDLVESNRISDIVYKIALGNPNISLSYIKDNKVILRTNRKQDLKNHIYSILGREFSENILGLDYESKGLTIKGFISNNQYYRGNRSHQYLYINDRFISNLEIAKAIENRYKSLIPLNRFPVFILFIYIDPGKIDVNIHPTKQEVKFTDEEEVIEIISQAVRKTLEPKIEIPKMNISREKPKKEEKIPSLFDFARKIVEDKIVEDKKEEKLAGFVEDLVIEDFREELPPKQEDLKVREEVESLVVEEDKLTRENPLESLTPIGSVFNTYIIAEDRLRDVIYFIDQHAAHERVMYEKYLKEFKAEKISIQGLISPLVMDLTNEETENVVNNLDLFKSLGFDLDEFGKNSIIIRGLPMLFGRANIKNLFLDILDNLDQVESSYDTKVSKIMKISCVNAVKSGDILDQREMLALFNSLKKCEHPHTCPHGRPTMLEMTRKHIEKEFLRIM